MVERVLLLTVATHMTHELERFIESAEHFGYDYEILGLGREWVGGVAENGRLIFPGGGMKVNLLKDYIGDIDDDTIILFTDSYDVVFADGPESIINKWNSLGGGMIFTAEKTCWPEPHLSKVYPDSPYDYRYLNSGGFLGRAEDIKKLIETNCEDSDDDQLYYTLKFLNSEGITLDYECDIFQTLNSSFDDVELHNGSVFNRVTKTYPTVIHANGGVGPRTFLNKLYNNMIKPKHDLKVLRGDETVMVQVVFDFQHTNPSVIMDSIEYLTYDKKLIDLVVFNNNRLNNWAIDNFIEKFKDQYNSVKYYYGNGESVYELRETALEYANMYGGDYVIQIDANHKLNNHDTIQLLMEENRDIIAPMINVEQTLNSNFWGGVDGNGYFQESDNYFPIRNYEDKGTFVVPFIKGVIMFKKEILNHKVFTLLYENNRDDEFYGDDYFVVFCNALRNSNLFMYVTNKRYYGKYFE